MRRFFGWLVDMLLRRRMPPPPESVEEYRASKFWRFDPFLGGRGVGLVLRMTAEDGCEITGVLRRSPAEKAGIKPGGVLVALDGYGADEGGWDLAELVFLLRTSGRRKRSMSVGYAGHVSDIRVGARRLRGLVAGELRMPGGVLGNLCNTCRHCWATTYGWINCGPTGCSSQCAVV